MHAYVILPYIPTHIHTCKHTYMRAYWTYRYAYTCAHISIHQCAPWEPGAAWSTAVGLLRTAMVQRFSDGRLVEASWC